MNKVLVVDDDKAVRDALCQTLELADMEAIGAGSFVEAKDRIEPAFAGVILSDIRMPGKDGFDLLGHARSVDPELPVILLTGEGDIPMAVRGMSEGAFDFLEKPCASADLLRVLQKALKTRALVMENRRLKRMVETGDAASRLLFGQSAAARELRERVRRVARTDAEVLISGAPGTGISKVAEVIHLLSLRAAGPLVREAAAALTPERLSAAIERAREVGHDAQRVAQGRLHLPLPQPVQQICHVLPGEELQRDEVLVARQAEVEQLADVGVGQARRHPRLVEKHLHDLGLARHVGQQPLEHHLLFEPRRPRALREEHLRHTPHPEAAQQVELA